MGEMHLEDVLLEPSILRPCPFCQPASAVPLVLDPLDSSLDATAGGEWPTQLTEGFTGACGSSGLESKTMVGIMAAGRQAGMVLGQ